MTQDVNFFTRALDKAYHSEFYQKHTEKGPLQMPNTQGAVVAESLVKEVKKTTGFFLDQMKNFLSDREDHDNCEELKDQVNHLHVPTARNWTRATNGLIQGVGVLGVSVLFRNGIFSRARIANDLLIIGAVGWGVVGIHHLNKANYADEQADYYWKNSTFVWTRKK